MMADSSLNDSITELMVQAIKQHQPMPTMPAGLNLDEAYQLQHLVTAKINQGKSAGIKAGLTNSDIQQFLGLEEGIIGSLYTQGKLISGCQFATSQGLQLECEIGVIIDDEGQPKKILPVIEIVYLDYNAPTDFTGPNIVASNIGADRFICGATQRWDTEHSSNNQNYDDILLSMTHDGQEVCQSSSKASLGGIVSGTQWIVQEARKRQFDLADNTLLILGTCGAPIAATPGEYRVNYEGLGCIEFTISAD
jgi:2-keto-4-pentenoate hydratase